MAPKIIKFFFKSPFAAKSYQNSQTYFILHDPVQEDGSGSHEDHLEEEEVKKWGWERQSFCPKVSVREVSSTVKFILVAQSFKGVQVSWQLLPQLLNI